ncbi:hypothetical protein [Bradyrhizobium sp. sGM-13]|uniref:hypothetical protein n=1 Tax=Bradyrhizobium sp. sGM-13 TaxID=2831781 RepID=UPI001BCFC840|nr:hypothetical protein [Bradyrhizobium sp. sGM-13]
MTDGQGDAQFLAILTRHAGTFLIFEIAHPPRDDFHRIVINFDESVLRHHQIKEMPAADEIRGGRRFR